MKKHKFSVAQRFALWKHYDQKCLLCDSPLDLADTTVDHVIPEHLLNKPEELANVKKEFGLDVDFNINDYPNWIPAHIRCNQKKSRSVFRFTPLVQNLLDRLDRNAEKVRAIESRFLKNIEKGNLLAKVMAGLEMDTITQKDLEELFPVPISSIDEDIATLYKEVCLHVDPKRWKVVKAEGNIAYVTDGKRGGVTPTTEKVDYSWYCPHCGSFGPWDGVRCQTCGMMSDPCD